MVATQRNAAPKKSASSATASSKKQKFVIDFSKPAGDKVCAGWREIDLIVELFDAAAFQQYMQSHAKVDNKAGNLGDKMTFTREGEGKLIVESSIPLSKRYLKYLTKRYLQKNSMREWLRVVATDKQTYTLKFYNLEDDEAA